MTTVTKIKIDMAARSVVSSLNAIKNEMNVSNDFDREFYQALSIMEMQFENAKRDYLAAKEREEKA